MSSNLLACVRVGLILVLGFASQGCAVRVGGPAGMPLQPAGTDANPLAASTPLSGPVSGALPQAPGASSLLGLQGGTALAGNTPLGTPQTPGPVGAPLAAGSTAQLDQWQGGKLPPEQFFRLIAPAVLESSRRTGVPASVTLAQAALETGWGKSSVGRAKNLFGIRGSGPAGSVQGNDNGEIANFRAYNSWSESIADHDRLLSTGARYRGAMAVRNNPEQFAREIHKAGYATNAGYADKLISIMRQYNLAAYTANA